jgi:hypothetical protein
MTQAISVLTVIKAGITYFGLVFGMGFVFGTMRVLLIVPQVGERLAELLEMPLILAVIFLAARWVVNRFQIPPNLAQRLPIGLLALVLVVLLEFTVVLGLRGLTIGEYLKTRDPVSGTVYYLMLGLFALMPYLVGRSSRVELNR